MNRSKSYLPSISAALFIGAVTAQTALAQPIDYSQHRPVLLYAEYLTSGENGVPGGFEFFFDKEDFGNGQTPGDFVYADPRNALFDGGGPGVSLAIKPKADSAYTSADSGLANQLSWFERSATEWTDLSCADAPLTLVNDSGAPGVVETFFKNGEIPLTWSADLTQVGFRSPEQFLYFEANDTVLGVAFTLSWTDAEGNLTDIDNNGRSDVAFREIYYNDDFNWSDNLTTRYDFPSVAIHEVGHGLGRAHFGLISAKEDKRSGNIFLFAKPRAVMNAIYGGPYRSLTVRDKGSYCSDWARWPNN